MEGIVHVAADEEVMALAARIHEQLSSHSPLEFGEISIGFDMTVRVRGGKVVSALMEQSNFSVRRMIQAATE